MSSMSVVSAASAQEWRAVAAEALPALAQKIVARIRREIPEYAADPEGLIVTETRRAVQAALQIFLRTITGQQALDDELAEVFRRIGRMEAAEGRSHDTLQAAYRIATQTVMRQLLDWEHELAVPPDTVAEISSAMFSSIDAVARLSAEGYASVPLDTETLAIERARLLSLLVQRRPFARKPVVDRAARLNWPLPDECAVVEVVSAAPIGDRALAQLARDGCGRRALAASVAGRQLIVAPERIDTAALRRALCLQSIPVRVFAGPVVAFDDVAESARLAYRASVTLECEARASGGVVLCDDHLLELFGEAGREVGRALGRQHLAPLMALTPAKRVKYGRLLSAWLEFGSIHGSAPGILDKHRQTLRYQITQLERMFGPALEDRSARLGMMVALRQVLPEWERAVAGDRMVRESKTPSKFDTPGMKSAG